MNEIHLWNGTPRKVIGDRQAYVTPLTFGRGRICIGPIDALSYEDGY